MSNNAAGAPAFRGVTRQNVVSLPALAFSGTGASGSIQTVNLPRTGWLQKFFLTITGTMTTGAGSPSGNWPTWPLMPFGLIQRIRVYTNTNVQIVNLSGASLLLVDRTMRPVMTPSQDLITQGNATNTAAILATPGSGTPAANTAYTWSGTLEVPIATDDTAMLGMLFLQSDRVTLTVEITFANSTVYAGTVSGVSVTPSFTIQPTAVMYEQPDDKNIIPNAQYVFSLKEDQYGFAATGQQLIRLPVGNTYTRIWEQIINNGAPLPYGNMGAGQITYAQTVTPYNESYINHLARNRSVLGQTLPDGVYMWDFASGSGIPTIFEGRDLVNSAQVTDLEVVTNIIGSPTLTNCYGLVVSQQLQAIGQ